MRIRITKNSVGKSSLNRKEVALRINKSGLSADGKQRYSLAIRFAGESYKKASSSDFVALELDNEENKLFFITANQADGFKLSSSSKNSSWKYIAITIDNVDEWKNRVGDYDLKKDKTENCYYIDLK